MKMYRYIRCANLACIQRRGGGHRSDRCYVLDVWRSLPNSVPSPSEDVVPADDVAVAKASDETIDCLAGVPCRLLEGCSFVAVAATAVAVVVVAGGGEA